MGGKKAKKRFSINIGMHIRRVRMNDRFSFFFSVQVIQKVPFTIPGSRGSVRGGQGQSEGTWTVAF